MKNHLSLNRLQTAGAVMILSIIGFSAIGCMDDQPIPADQRAQNQQEVLNREALAQTGMPGISNFTEKKLVKKLYELRDKSLVTYTYVPDMQGRLWHVCDSIGFGLPYGVQYTSPEKAVYGNTSPMTIVTLPQSEPNGLFMPSTAEGTWVFCANPDKSGDAEPVYIEPRVIVSPFKMRAAGEWALAASEAPGKAATSDK